MIFVERPVETDEVREALLKPIAKRGEQPETELQKARRYYSDPNRPPKAYSFARYKEFAVGRALEAMFHGKCAYCESSYGAVDARDIEHFRPKGGVTEAQDHPGYWWLAATWENLLPSCPPCNQKRRQLSFDPGMTDEEFERLATKEPAKMSGKANSFPIRGAAWAKKEGEDLSVEDPLLINPCERNPSDHIEFVFDWDEDKEYIWEAKALNPVVRPKEAGGTDDPYAKASIAVYGLNRAGLFRARSTVVTTLQMMCQPIVDLLPELRRRPSARRQAEIQTRLTKYRANLLAFTQAEREYSAMTRAFVAKFEQELNRLANDATP